MTPPFLARAIVAAVAPPLDYDVVSGDLHEEYVRRAASNGAAADLWYWSQTLRSVPSLLSYSRSGSLASNLASGLIVAGVLLAMLVANELVGDVVHRFYGEASGLGAWPYFVTGWLVAVLAGAVLAAAVRSQGIRLALVAAGAFVAVVAVPIAFSFSSPLTLPTWILVLGAVPALCAGTATYQIIRRR
jgi:hypothetical protein